MVQAIPEMNVRKLLTSVVLSLALLPAAAVGADAKIAYVNVPYLIDNSPQAKAASSQLEERFGPKKQELQSKQQEFQQLQQKLQKDGLTSMSEQERQQAQERLRTLKREIQRMQQAFREDLNMERNNAFKDVRQAVMEAVQKLAKDEGYDLVVGQGALYASDAVNLTQRVLDRMKENYDGGGSGSS
jgi:outer membrane protein